MVTVGRKVKLSNGKIAHVLKNVEGLPLRPYLYGFGELINLQHKSNLGLMITGLV